MDGVLTVAFESSNYRRYALAFATVGEIITEKSETLTSGLRV